MTVYSDHGKRETLSSRHGKNAGRKSLLSILRLLCLMISRLNYGSAQFALLRVSVPFPCWRFTLVRSGFGTLRFESVTEINRKEGLVLLAWGYVLRMIDGAESNIKTGRKNVKKVRKKAKKQGNNEKINKRKSSKYQRRRENPKLPKWYRETTVQMQRFQQKYHDEYTTVIPENAFAEGKSAEDLKRRRSVSKDSPERQRKKEKKM